MSYTCSYCGRSGHSVRTCSERQEDYFGTPDDPSGAMADRVGDGDARTDGGESGGSAGGRETVYVEDTPKCMAARHIGADDGRCQYQYFGIGQRCSNDAAAHTFFEFEGEQVVVEMCAGHAREDVPERPTNEQKEILTDGGRAIPDLRAHIDDALERARRDGVEHATLAFAEEYVPAVRRGDKTVTLRRPGAYDVAVRHAAERAGEVVLVDGAGVPFARAEIRAVWKVDAEDVVAARLAGYPDVACADDVVRILERHYELEIGGDAARTRVHAIHFDVIELLREAVLDGGEA